MIRKENRVQVEGLAGGTGPATVCHILTKDELMGHGRMYAKVILPPGSSLGFHQHVHETEPYYILSGVGDFTDNDGSVTKVTAGDCCLIEPGQSHCIANNGTEDLVFMALIYND